MTTLRSISLNALAIAVLSSAALLCSVPSIAQTAPTPAARIVSPIDEGQMVALKGNVNPNATAANDRGPVSPTLPMADMMLVLGRSPEVQAAFDAYVAGQYDRNSPDYHQWLTPAEIGARFGAAQSDIAAISAWLSSHSFTVTSVTNDRMSIHFTGTAAQAESAFHVEIHNLAVGSEPHIANMTDPQIPAAIAPVVLGVKGLHNFLPHPNHKVGSLVKKDQASGKWQAVAPPAAVVAAGGRDVPQTKQPLAAKPRPQFGINGCGDSSDPCDDPYLEEDVSPYDFATIYNVQPLWNINITGTNQTIAIAGTSDIDPTDPVSYRQTFGLPAGPSVILAHPVNGTDPGECTSTAINVACGQGDLVENSLDVEMAGSVAPNAQIVLVTSGYNSQTNPTNDPLYADAEFVISNHGNPSVSPTQVASASILSMSYGECELYNGTAGNAAYYNLWETAAAEGISVFVSTGDSGAPSCDDGLDEAYGYGNPYSARYGTNVSGLASTPWNTAVGGTDFSWCKPVLDGSGNVTGCPSSSSGASPYWNTTNNGTTGASAAGYVPEIPWNDTCTNPILAAYVNSVAPLSPFNLPAPASGNVEATCNFIQNYWYEMDQDYEEASEQEFDVDDQFVLAPYIDTIGGGGGASNCVLNATDAGIANSCSANATSTGDTVNPDTGNAQAALTLYNNGWPKPSWQAGVTGIPQDGVRDIPDVSFFAGNGELDSATLICVSALSTCTYSNTEENYALEVGGTSVATPQMAGVMALVNQKIGTPQGLANPELYQLATAQTYSSCRAESVTASGSCYFNDIDQGTISMPCDLGATEGGAIYTGSDYQFVTPLAGINSPDCAAFTSGDTVGTLVVPNTTTVAYNAGAGYDLATGLGSLNVANVVNAWTSDVGTGSTTITLQASPTSITINQSDTVTVTVAGGAGAPTGTVVLAGGGYTSGSVSLASGSATIVIPANSLSAGSDTLTAYYSGDSNYATFSNTLTLTVNVMTPTVTVNAPSADNVANAVGVTVTVAGPSGSATPTGTITLSSGNYSKTMALASGSAAITIPANTLAVNNSDTLTATYIGDANYAGGTGTATIAIVSTSTLTPTIAVTPASSAINSSQTLAVTVAITGSGATPTGTVSITAGPYTSSITPLASGSASFTIPANTLSTGTVTITATYSGDPVYSGGSNHTTVNVNQSNFTIATPTNPAAISPGSSATVTINGSQSSTNYSGTVSLTTCTPTSSSVTNTGGPISCSVSGTITYTNGTPSGSATATVTTTAASAELVYPKLGNGKGWLGAGAGTVLAFVVFLGIPARRRSWRAMLGMIVLLLVGLGGMAACGGGGGSGGGSTGTAVLPTTAGTYTFTVTGTSSPAVTPVPSTTFTVTVN